MLSGLMSTETVEFFPNNESLYSSKHFWSNSENLAKDLNLIISLNLYLLLTFGTVATDGPKILSLTSLNSFSTLFFNNEKI